MFVLSSGGSDVIVGAAVDRLTLRLVSRDWLEWNKYLYDVQIVIRGWLFFGQAGKIIRMTNIDHHRWKTWAKDSVRVLLTKNPACSCHWCQDHGISFDGSRGPGRQLARYRVPAVLLTPATPFLKRWSPLPELRRSWFACTGTSDWQMRPGSEPPPSARGVSSRVPIGLVLSGMSALYRPAPRTIGIHITQALPRWQRGDTVGRDDWYPDLVFFTKINWVTSFFLSKVYFVTITCVFYQELVLRSDHCTKETQLVLFQL